MPEGERLAGAGDAVLQPLPLALWAPLREGEGEGEEEREAEALPETRGDADPVRVGDTLPLPLAQ